MAENTKNVEFKNPHPELPVREPILKLGKMVTDRSAIIPSFLRSSGRYAIPSFMASSGELIFTSFPFTFIFPLSGLSAP